MNTSKYIIIKCINIKLEWNWLPNWWYCEKSL